jgi:hypothetical protein
MKSKGVGSNQKEAANHFVPVPLSETTSCAVGNTNSAELIDRGAIEDIYNPAAATGNFEWATHSINSFLELLRNDRFFSFQMGKKRRIPQIS